MGASSHVPWSDAYMAAWSERNVEAILGFHTEDTVFTSAAFGRHAVGKAQVGAAFAGMFELWPDLMFETRRLYLTPELIVFESTAKCTQKLPLTVAGESLQPTGRKISFDVADIFPLRDGLIARKDTYFDALAYIRAMRSGE